jgi:hypothetical protein
MLAPRTDAARSLIRRISSFLALALAATGFTTIAAVVHGTVVATPAGAATYLGSAARMSLARPIVQMAATPTAKGYWLVGSDGRIFSFGDAHYYGSTGGIRLAKPIVGMTSTRTGRGYWLVASDGGIFSFGDARFHGSTGGMRLNKPIVGMAATPAGNGYWLVASDGGVFSFGDARFRGSTGGIHLNQPIVGMATTPAGNGYWMVASDGGIFAFGDARFYGSAGNRHLVEPIVGMSAARPGGGYWLVGRDGAVFAYGSARFYGSAAGAMAGQPAVDIVASPKNDGYWIASQWGGVNAASASGMHMDPNLRPRTGEGAIAAELIKRINTERAARGLRMLTPDPLLQSSASAWARYLASTRQFKHQDLGTVLRKSAGRFAEVGENMYGGSGLGAMDAGTAHVTLMHSDGHRANILMPEERLVGVGASCVNGMLIVVEDFATPFGIPLKSHPVPPLNPIASGNEGGASC